MRRSTGKNLAPPARVISVGNIQWKFVSSQQISVWNIWAYAALNGLEGSWTLDTPPRGVKSAVKRLVIEKRI